MSTAQRILLVDDDHAFVRAMGAVLKARGFEVTPAANGMAGFAEFRKSSFDLVVSDLDMPGIDGLQLLRAIREHDLDVPVIFVTGNASVDSAIEALRYGALNYLRKPVDATALVSAVQKAIQLGRVGRLRRDALGSDQAQALADNAGLDVSFTSALDKLWMAYQPIVQWSTRKVVAYEALMRSREPKLPHPGAILDAGERLGRLRELGRRVRDLAPAPLWMTDSEVRLFVNLHVSDLEDEHLFDVAQALSGASTRVVLEITERAALTSVKDVRSRISRLRERGFKIALDDIGAGYAGLTSFAQLDPDVVKVDMSLVRNVHQDQLKQKLIASLVALCTSLDRMIIAEGIETTEERDTLLALGCDYFQGYLFAKPDAAFPSVRW